MSNRNYRLEDMMEIEGRTDAQDEVIRHYDTKGNRVVCMTGSAGTGKTFLGIALGLYDVLDNDTPYDKLIIIRSVVPTREIGYLPGNEDEKLEAYAAPYKGICSELFNQAGAWKKLTDSKMVSFESTSFIRGTTFNNAIVLVDEMQNLNFHELDSVITRIGKHTRLLLSGDYHQSDFKNNSSEKAGINKFLTIIESLNNSETVEFKWGDIVRSGLVRDYIMTKEHLSAKGKLE